MFPTLQVSVTGLEPNAEYAMVVDFVPCDEKRYRYSFHTSCWVVAGTALLHFTFLNVLCSLFIDGYVIRERERSHSPTASVHSTRMQSVQ